MAESEQKNEFLAIMSHELKHPLNLISVNAQLLTTLPEAKKHSRGRPGRPNDSTHRDEPGADHRRPARHVACEHGQVDGESRATGVGRSGPAGGELGDLRGPRAWASVCLPKAWMSLSRWTAMPRGSSRSPGTCSSNAIKFSRPGGTIRVRLREQSGQAVFEGERQRAGDICRVPASRVSDVQAGRFGHEAGRGRFRHRPGNGQESDRATRWARRVGFRRGREAQRFGSCFRFTRAATSHALDSGDSAAPSSLAGLRVLLVDDTQDALETFQYLLEVRRLYQVTSASERQRGDRPGGAGRFLT